MFPSLMLPGILAVLTFWASSFIDEGRRQGSFPDRDDMSQRCALIVAAGSSRRFGGSVPKQLLPLLGVTPIERVLKAFTQPFLEVGKVALAVAADQKEKAISIISNSDFLGAQYVERHPLAAVFNLASAQVFVYVGGSSRADSVNKGLQVLSQEGVKGDDHVLVHDAARCFILPSIVHQCYQALEQHPVCSVAAPCVDTIKMVSDEAPSGATSTSTGGKWLRTLPREQAMAVQTPQGFHFSVLQSGHASSRSGDDQVITDDLALVEGQYPVALIESDESVRKITTQADLAWAKVFAAQSGQVVKSRS